MVRRLVGSAAKVSFTGVASRPDYAKELQMQGTQPADLPVQASANGHKRTSRHAPYRLRCTERCLDGAARSFPVQLVVFDFDETLTLVTYMPVKRDSQDVLDVIVKICFETPWVEGSRIAKLGQMLHDLATGVEAAEGSGCSTRTLAVLTKNSNSEGVRGVQHLLAIAGLDRYFSAIWSLPNHRRSAQGMYKEGGDWKTFEPPVPTPYVHKADVLQEIVKSPSAWFPQLLGDSAANFGELLRLRPEGIVLVDDQRSNFQSEVGAQVLRYCKVARYDARYRGFGMLKDMGGIGAHDKADYEMLKQFVEHPGICKESLEIRCFERRGESSESRDPVQLVVFDFDETLTLATFVPGDPRCAEVIGWTMESKSACVEWTKTDFVKYNFESPYIDGNRVAKLKCLFEELICSAGGQRRSLAILSRNENGAVAVLNLLQFAGLADSFSAIWTIPRHRRRTNKARSVAIGVYNEAGQWKLFRPPFQDGQSKADIVQQIARDPGKWFPGDDGPAQLKVEEVVLVDDERAEFRSDDPAAEASPLRFCKVARYDDIYWDCGALNQLGGIGAHSDEDYKTLKAFVEQPWEYAHEWVSAMHVEVEGAGEMPSRLTRTYLSEESPKASRERCGHKGVGRQDTWSDELAG
eukprot:CAMPEP_0117580770 /NCGR_PEP_ID=MMETSP0784-20121206/65412_1 /TAXON_ID=39447 /ORGANISM="" /LENGTH=635 /DNA_ID=CAMNT_0005380919 /DNA_START=40 /DNA_END=1948 /DNA_ORIENTATION=+